MVALCAEFDGQLQCELLVELKQHYLPLRTLPERYPFGTGEAVIAEW